MKARALIAGLAAALLAAAGLAAVVGCADRVAGGTIETTNGLTARVVLPSGEPAASIKVFLVDEQDWLAKTKANRSIYLDSAETDMSGEFKIDTVDTNRSCALYADAEGYAFFIHGVTRKVLKTAYQGRIGMSKKVSYEGNIQSADPKPRKIFLAGSPFSADVDADGHFVIQNIPQEHYSVIILRQLADESPEYVAGDNVKLDEWTEGKHDTIVPPAKPTILVEDFEDMDNRGSQGIVNRIGNIIGGTGGGGWTAYTDAAYNRGTSSISSPATMTWENWIKAITAGGGDATRSLRVQYKTGLTLPAISDKYFRPEDTVPFVVLSTNFGAQNVHYNLSRMDSLTFASGGSGQLVVELVQQNPKSGNSNQSVTLCVIASKTFDLGTWEVFTLKPADLQVRTVWFPDNPDAYRTQLLAAGLPAYDKPPTTWAEMGGMATEIRFKGINGKEFWLDDIRIHGINVGDLIK
jgi:hypothetical protein